MRIALNGIEVSEEVESIKPSHIIHINGEYYEECVAVKYRNGKTLYYTEPVMVLSSK